MVPLKHKKVITVLTIITTAITLISLGLSFGIRIYLSYKLRINLHRASSMGIIGGSDGPTSIFIPGIPSSNSITVIFGLLSIIGILYLISMKKLQK